MFRLFSFAVVRSPFDRIVSVWAQKVLLVDPDAIKLGVDTITPVDTATPSVDLRASFEQFVDRLQGDWAACYLWAVPGWVWRV